MLIYGYTFFKVQLHVYFIYSKTESGKNGKGQEYTPCTTHKTFGLKIFAASEVYSWYLLVQIKYIWRLLHKCLHDFMCIYIYELNRAEDTLAWTTSFICII